jgi:GT2 family glycosyltransferase
VLYNNPIDMVNRVIECVINSTAKCHLIIIDNSPGNDFDYLMYKFPSVIYVKTGINLGFGSAHNLAMRFAFNKYKYHLIINPDVEFDVNAIERLSLIIDGDDSIGLVVPEILNFNGVHQFLCKKLPTPLNLLTRVLNSIFHSFFDYLNGSYELRHLDYTKVICAPNLSGCFMLFRLNIFNEINFFDDRFFLYLEDVDLSRRIYMKYQAIYSPSVKVFHHHSKGSFRLFGLFKIHVFSAIYYFNKWGWFFDKSRSSINYLFKERG